MATALASGNSSHLTCGICEESYNESDRLPKGFPCQHNMCMSCLDKMIARCDREDFPCPVCRLSVPIPVSRAAGFPNNLTILGLLESISASTTCRRHQDKTVSAFCMTCQKAICMTCLIKSRKHNGHEVEELADAMERCMQQAQDEVDQIVSLCSAVHDKIKHKAKENNLECFNFLRQLQKCKSDLKVGMSLSDEDEIKQVTPDMTKVIAENPLKEELPVLASDSFPAVSLPQQENKAKVVLQTAVKLPSYRHIDMNRSNSLLMTSSHGQYALYKFCDNKYGHMDLPTLSDESIRMLAQAEDVLVSHDNKLVIPGEFELMYDNKIHSLYRKSYNRVKLLHGNWFVCIHHNLDALECLLYAMNNTPATPQGYAKLLSTKLQSTMLVVPTDRCYGLAIINICDTSTVKTITIEDLAAGRDTNQGVININQSTSITWKSGGPVHLWPKPRNVSSAAVIKNVVMLVENDNTIAVYVMKQPEINARPYSSWKYTNSYNRVCELKMRELGLTPDCKLQRIWAGDRVDGKSLLHVLYTRPRHGNTLASYTVSEEVLNKGLVSVESGAPITH